MTMTKLPLAQSAKAVGIYQVLTNAESDEYVLTIPAGASGCVLSFVTSEEDMSHTWGRVLFSDSDAEIEEITATNMAWHYSGPIEFDLSELRAVQTASGARYLHLVGMEGGEVALGFWTYASQS